LGFPASSALALERASRPFSQPTKVLPSAALSIGLRPVAGIPARHPRRY